MECGDCTICCTLLPVPVLDKPEGQDCVHCNKGCMIHATKSDYCKSFNCAYVQMDHVSETLRPDICGVIFEKFDTFILGVFDYRKDRMSEDAGRQVQMFVKEGIPVVLVNGKVGGAIVYAPEGTDEAKIMQAYYDLRAERCGS